jgi:TRAP-type uncharacterized transport system substrate-binding protein
MRMLRPLLAAALLVVSGLAFSQQQYINVLTGGTSGVYYPLGVAMSRLIGNAIPDAKVSVQSTKASVENQNLLQQGRGALAVPLGG